MNIHDRRMRVAHDMIDSLTGFPMVNTCTLHGSLASDSYDRYSDIDLQVDVSGYNNGEFMLELPGMLQPEYPILYTAFAPGLLPEVYVVSFALQGEDIFSFIDFECLASPHISTVTRDDVRHRSDAYCLPLKLTLGNAKHFLRGQPCHDDIVRIAKFVMNECELAGKDERGILLATLRQLETLCPEPVRYVARQCRHHVEENTNTL